MTTQALQEEEVGTVVQAKACSYDAVVERYWITGVENLRIIQYHS